MGIWDFISWSTDSVKGLWQSSYDQSCTAITKIDKVVRVDAAEMVNQHLSDPETRSKLSRVATNVAKNATLEGLKFIPGAHPAYKVVSKSLAEENKSKNENKSKEYHDDLKALQATVERLEKEVEVLREQAVIREQAVKINPENTVQDQKPKEMTLVSTMKEFIRSHM